MKLNLDLHTHSLRSPDGRMTLEEMTAAAKAKGLHAIAVSDHDLIYEGPAALNGVLIIPAAEFSTEHGHMVGLFIRDIVPSRDFREAADRVHAAGGLTVMAHPFQRNPDEARFLPLLPYLDGMEVWNGRGNRKDPKANARAAAFAKKHGLFPSAGSDAHILEEIGNGVLTVETEDCSLEAIKAALLAGKGTVSGREGRDICVARSQFTKLRKTHASPLRYGKWAAFAAVCVLRDGKRQITRSGGIAPCL